MNGKDIRASATVILDLHEVSGGKAKLSRLDQYIDAVSDKDLDGRDVVLTGGAPIWLYLKVAHALHGRAKRLYYRSPALGDANDLLIFDHDPF